MRIEVDAHAIAQRSGMLTTGSYAVGLTVCTCYVMAITRTVAMIPLKRPMV